MIESSIRLHLLLLHHNPLLLILQSLLPLYIFEHIFVLREDHVIGEHFWILLVEFKHSGESLERFRAVVVAFEEFTHVVEYQVVFEDRDDVRVLVVDNVVYYLYIVVLATGQVLLVQILLYYLFAWFRSF